jgi:hypothetical protein
VRPGSPRCQWWPPGRRANSRSLRTTRPCRRHSVRASSAVMFKSSSSTRTLGTIFVVLRCPLDRQEPALAPLHPHLGFRLQFEGRLIQTSEPNLDERVTETDWVKQSRPTEGAEATSSEARDLTAHLKRVDGPMPIHDERASRLLSAIRAVAAPDVYRVSAHAVADRPAEASARAYSRLHTWMVRNTAVGQATRPMASRARSAA